MSRYCKSHISTFIKCLLVSMVLLAASGVTTNTYAVDEAIRQELIYRASFGRAEDIKLLVKQGASPDTTNNDGMPLLAIASVRSDDEALNVIKALVELGGNVNATDPRGKTALFYAARAGNVAVAKTLLEQGIDSQAVDIDGNSARLEALHYGHRDVLDAIDDYAVEQVKKAQEEKAKKEREAAQKAADDAKAAALAAKKAAEERVDAAKKEAEEKAAALDKLKSAAAKKEEDANAQTLDRLKNITATPAASVDAKAADASAPAAKADGATEPADAESKKDAEEAASPAAAVDGKDDKDASAPAAKADAAETPKTDKADDAKKAEDDGTAAPGDNKETMLTPAQEKEFDDIIKHSIEGANSEQPDNAESDATEPAPKDMHKAKTKHGLNVKTPEQVAAAAAARQEIALKRKEEIKRMAYDAAYHSCSFQYWVYCLQVGQSTELEHEELTIAIQAQQEAAEAVEKKMLVSYHLQNAFYDNITASAQQRVFDQINSMATNRQRHENGVGKMDDMEKRCEEIARQWNFPASLKSMPSAVSRLKPIKRTYHPPRGVPALGGR